MLGWIVLFLYSLFTEPVLYLVGEIVVQLRERKYLEGRSKEGGGFGNCQQLWSLIHWNPNEKTPGSQK
jgi:hypothetical protein